MTWQRIRIYFCFFSQQGIKETSEAFIFYTLKEIKENIQSFPAVSIYKIFCFIKGERGVLFPLVTLSVHWITFNCNVLTEHKWGELWCQITIGKTALFFFSFLPVQCDSTVTATKGEWRLRLPGVPLPFDVSKGKNVWGCSAVSLYWILHHTHITSPSRRGVCVCSLWRKRKEASWYPAAYQPTLYCCFIESRDAPDPAG